MFYPQQFSEYYLLLVSLSLAFLSSLLQYQAPLIYYIAKANGIYCLNKLSSKEIYSILIESTDLKPSSQMYCKNIFENSNLDWKTIYMLPCIVTKDSRLRVFQYKLLNNVLYLNKMLFRFGKIDSPLCSFCKMIEETPLHLFYNCIKTNFFGTN